MIAGPLTILLLYGISVAASVAVLRALDGEPLGRLVGTVAVVRILSGLLIAALGRALGWASQQADGPLVALVLFATLLLMLVARTVGEHRAALLLRGWLYAPPLNSMLAAGTLGVLAELLALVALSAL